MSKKTKSMTPLQAYQLTLEKVAELKQSGIEVKITPCQSRNNKKLISDINNKTNIHPDKWINVNFASLTIGQVEKINQVADYLGLCGIQFDMGGFQWERDWNLDWSFKYTGKEDLVWAEARHALENTISKAK